ncbi:MAG: protein kinase [Planctomycetaceae bacterium]|nr:protein kinase [Planctomycetaceae bacterium]
MPSSPGDHEPHRPSGDSSGGADSKPENSAYSKTGIYQPNEPPEEFGRYRIDRELGRGGMGAVYLAHDTQLDRKVALKIPTFKEDRYRKDAIERFFREARVMANMQHANLCPVFDVGEYQHWHYLTMAYIDGESLSEKLRRSQEFPLSQALVLLQKVAQALHLAHQAGVIHRDLKPANIMITKAGEPVIMDFGLALRQQADEAELTHSGAVLGSPSYMSPEQVEARHDEIGPATDVYALGVILYQMITGTRPFVGSVASIFGQIVSMIPDPPSSVCPELPSEIDSICMKALEKSPADRHTSAAEFATALSHFLTRSGQVDHSPTVSYHPEKDAPSSGSHSRNEAELRQVTIAIFAYEPSEAFESGSMASHSELFHNQAKIFESFVMEKVRELGGTFIDTQGEEVTACFGFPQTYEDAPQRAVRVALQVMKALAEAKESQEILPDKSQTRVTIHSGEAVVEIKDSGSDSNVSIIGDARNMVRRLDTISESGAIVISAATHRRVALYFECESLGAQRIRGIKNPIELFEVKKEAASRNRVELVDPGNLTPLVGRDTELTILKDRWEQAVDELGQVVLLIGDAGLGKSRLIRELREHVIREEADQATVVELRCSQYHMGTSFYPIIEYFQQLLEFEDRSQEERLNSIESYLQELNLSSDLNIALVCDMLSVPLNDRYPALTFSPQRIKEVTQEFLLNWLREMVARDPVLFIVEDLHWLDPSTLKLLETHVSEFERGQILSLLTFRPEFETPWKSKPHQTQIALNRLTKRQIGMMMRKRTNRDDIPDVIVRQIIERTDGIPLFIEEFTVMVIEAGILDSTDVEASAESLQKIPATLYDLLLSRLDRMQANHEVIQFAATIGREFSFELLDAVSTLPNDVLLHELDKLVKAEILFQKGQGGDASYIFKHALLQDAAYRSMLSSKRQAYHQRIAEILETKFPNVAESQPELLANHFTASEMSEKAVQYWLKAGLKSRDRSADVEAIGHLTKGRELLESLPESPERDSLELQLLNPLGTAYIASKGYAAPEVGPVFARARELCEKLGESNALFTVMWGIWVWHLVCGELPLCRDLAQEAIDWAESGDDRDILMEAHHLPAVTKQYRGDFSGARHHSSEAVRLCDDPEVCRIWTARTGQNSSVAHRCYLFLPLWHLGEVDDALKVNEEAINLAREIAHPFTIAYVLHHTGWFLLQCRLGTRLQAIADEQIAITSEQGFPFWHASGNFFKGAGLYLEGNIEEGLTLMEKGLDAWLATGAELTLTYQFCTLCQAYLTAGRLEDAQKALERGLELVEKNEERCQEAELYRMKGGLILAQSSDETADAEACFQRSLEIAKQQQARAWELRTTVSLARLWKSQGLQSKALEILLEVYSTWTQDSPTPDLTEAASLLEELR